MQKPKLRSLFMPTLGLKMKLDTWIHPHGNSYVPNVAIFPLTPNLGYVGNNSFDTELEEGEVVPQGKFEAS